MVCDGQVSLENKADYLENQSRRNNLVLEGTEESADETWAVSETKVRKVFTEVLKINPERAKSIAVERAHRTGRSGDRKERSRPVVVKFPNFKDREGILTMAREKRSMKMRGTGIYINEDFSDLVRQRRREQLPKLKEERQKGNIAYFR